jgi:uncharacterized membrane protein
MYRSALGATAMIRALLVLLAVLAPALHAEPDAVASNEIAHLIAQLGASGCQFNRNGTWYASSAAQSHLQRKYEYLLEKNLVTTAETFIERAGSESSRSGKPYVVKCGDAEAVKSAEWLTSELKKYRATKH